MELLKIMFGIVEVKLLFDFEVEKLLELWFGFDVLVDVLLVLCLVEVIEVV